MKMLKASIQELNLLLGNIDIYLLDQILKARFEKHFKILDAGCGEGRNLIYFIRNEYQVYGIDKDKDSIQMLKHLIKSIDEEYPISRFINGNLEEMPYKQHEFDAIISSAVLHFAESKDHFLHMFHELNRVLKYNGILFIRMTSDIGMEEKVKPMGKGKYLLPDKSVRFLLTKKLLNEIIDQFGYSFEENFKSVVVDENRSMAVLVLRKL